MRKLQRAITRLFAVLFLLSLTYISKAQEMTYNGNKATATCEVEIVAYPGGDGYYHQIPVFTYQWVCSDIYEKYTSFLKKRRDWQCECISRMVSTKRQLR